MSQLTEEDIAKLVAVELEPSLGVDWDAPPDPSWDVEDKVDGEEPPQKKIYAISDIHTEFYESATEIYNKIIWPSASHLVLAGDIGVIKKNLRVYHDFLLLCKKRYKNVILIPGNHEYYYCDGNRTSVEKVLEELCKKTGVVYLQGKNIVVDGIRFIGHTLWSIIDKDSCARIADFSNGVFSSQIEYVLEFAKGYQFIQDEILKSIDTEEPIVVVTHHLPSRKLVHPKFAPYGALNSAFATDVIGALTGIQKIKYWFCGHTHEYGQIKAFDTVLVANPVGYPHEQRLTGVSQKTYPVQKIE